MSIYEQLAALPYLTAYRRLITGAVELDVFSHLETPVTAETLAGETGWNTGGTLQLLRGLTAVGFVLRKGDAFVNAEETSRYLVRGKPYYMGDVLTFFDAGNAGALENLKEQVKNGPLRMEEAPPAPDFTVFGAAMRVAQSGIRRQEILDVVRALPENGRIRRVLDLGCGTGMLGLSLLEDGPDRSAVLFDLPAMKPLIDESIAMSGMADRAVSMGGDFMRDSFGKGYDLILCCSVMTFAAAGGPDFFRRLKAALNPGGVALCIGEGIERDASGPWDMVLGFLSFPLQGMPLGLEKGTVEKLAAEGGFASAESRTALLSTGTQEIVILR